MGETDEWWCREIFSCRGLVREPTDFAHAAFIPRMMKCTTSSGQPAALSIGLIMANRGDVKDVVMAAVDEATAMNAMSFPRIVLRLMLWARGGLVGGPGRLFTRLILGEEGEAKDL